MDTDTNAHHGVNAEPHGADMSWAVIADHPVRPLSIATPTVGTPLGRRGATY